MSVNGKRTVLFLVNRHKEQPVRVRIEGLGSGPSPTAMLHTLAADSLTTVNTLSAPNQVRARTQAVSNWQAGLELPAASVNVLELTTT